MAIYLGLGSNLGDRREQLRRAVAALGESSIELRRLSPVVESPAMLPPAAPPDWNLPFLNAVAHCETSLPPEALLAAIKRIERQLGRDDARRWAPRPIDIDILLYDELELETGALSIPHRGLADRDFFLGPLTALAPGLIVPGRGVSVLALNRLRPHRIPLWMGIINLTPDSFSDGGRHQSWPAVAQRLAEMTEAGAQLIDLGAESTRPGATPLTPDQEWARLEPILSRALDSLAGDPLRPAISVDTYHAGVAGRALAAGADLINDVGGLSDPAMLALAVDSGVDFIAMHNLGLPADRRTTLDPERSATDQVEAWLDRQLERWRRAGLDPARIIFDPGIGFGKNPLQSLALLRDIDRFADRGLRLLVGHSRKSFLQGLSGNTPGQRDLLTIGGSLALCAHRVDIIRVHNVADHMLAYRGWAHLQPPG